MFKNLRTGVKLYLGFGTVILLALAMAGYNYVSYSDIKHSTHYAQEELYPIMKTANEMTTATIQVQQWCTDISATRGQDGYNDGLDEAEKAATQFRELQARLIQLDPTHASQLQDMTEPFDEYYETGVKMANAYIKGGPSFGNTMMEEFDGDAEHIRGLVGAYYTQVEEQFNEGMESIEEKTIAATQLGTTLAILSLIIGAAIAFFIARVITKPVIDLAKIAEEVAVGNVNQTITYQSRDEIGQLSETFRRLVDYMKELATAADAIASNDLTVDIAPKSEEDALGNAFKTMTTNLTGMVRQLGDNATQLVSAATEVASSAEQMSKGANDQTEQVGQVSAAIEEMTATIVESSKNAGEATDGARGASETANVGGQIVNETIQGMQRIADVVRESAESIGKLAKSADQIGEIIGVIDDIADQTNLLALNAAIEAARAGEQGRGFADVADEVRKLAERTGKATGEITGMIKGIQDETSEAVQSMETGINEVDTGREMADKAGNSLNEIVNVSQRVMDMIQQIATASEEQSVAAEQISKNVENVASIARESSSGAEQSATAAEELNRQAEGLQQMVGQFKVNA
ncbi:MAG: methyl-accepting chemotaxis protein [Candidatus Zixiibacteriota bacterium]